jgi:hypothetical protein
MDFKVATFSGCHPIILSAIGTFNSTSEPYSISSRRYSIYRLIQDVIDPAIHIYIDSLPKNHDCFSVGVTGLTTDDSISVLCKTCGFEAIERSMREGLRRYIKTHCGETDWVFVSTVDSLISLVVACASKRSKKKISRNHEPININRKGRPWCEFCGNKTELAEYLDSTDTQVDEGVALSSRYCSEHKPLSHNGTTWNSAYKRGARAKVQFEVELSRLTRQACKLSAPQSKTGDSLVDHYIWRFVAQKGLYPDEKIELRNYARKMVDRKLTDQKKRILMLLSLGESQVDIARRLGLSRQGVSKAVGSVPIEYRLDI